MLFGDINLKKEKQTIACMLQIYCTSHHGKIKSLCHDCQEILNYAFIRLDKCPFANNKPNCTKCVVHCYKPDMKARVKEVMRYSGPKMLFKHPLLSLHHFISSLKKTPTLNVR